jgi:type II secretory pathway predicted ATPase ExeA
MYETFFHLARRPFEISPDPSMFYATTQHREALAGLFYGITAGKGLMVLTGEVGTGKTLVVRCLQELLGQKRVTYAFVFNPRLSSREFLSYVAQDLGLCPCPTAKSDLLLGLGRLLIERGRQGVTTVLVVEEAQHLTSIVLEETRLLTNLESAQGKLLQILLLGQPELAKTIASSQMRQLRQRITLWFRLSVLSEEETSNYVQYRLKLAGDGSGKIFTPDALERVYRLSLGTPRVINTLCDNAMISAATLRREHVTPELIENAASALDIRQPDGTEETTTPQAQWQASKIAEGEMGGPSVISEAVGPGTGPPPREEGL